MRIDLLLKREPFDQIVEQTLSRFWSEVYDQDFHVGWHYPNHFRWSQTQKEKQLWLCNIYLNSFFVPRVHAKAFEPIRKEFSRSTLWWKRPAQRAYVAVSSSAHLAHLFAHASVQVEPVVPHARDQLIVAGNHKFRILNHRAGMTLNLLKSNENPTHFLKEIETRELVVNLGLPVPGLREISDDYSWYSEEYISGTPINRLRQADNSVNEAADALLILARETARQESIENYARDRLIAIRDLATINNLLQQEECHLVTRQAEELVSQIGQLQQLHGGLELCTTICHGDFHPANILKCAQGVRLIDWEFSTRRQAGYDLLIYLLKVRFPMGLGQRLEKFVCKGPENNQFADYPWPGMNWSDYNQRLLYVNLLLLEELELNLVENANSTYLLLSTSLRQLVDEISYWLENVSVTAVKRSNKIDKQEPFT